MDPIGRVILGCMALFILWTLLRAARTGVIYSQGTGFDVEQSPMLFVLALLCHAGAMIFFATLAAGFTMTQIKQLVLAGFNLTH